METKIVTGTTESYDEKDKEKLSAAVNEEGKVVGEELVENSAEENEKILGKFNTVDDLAAAYKELEKKLGSKKETEVTHEDAQEAVTAAGLDFDALSEEYATNGALTDESYEKLAKSGIPKEIVDNYIEAVSTKNQLAADATAKEVMNVAGGKDKYQEVISWAAKSLDAEAIDAFNQAVNSGNLALAKIAAQGLVTQYQKEMGSDPKLIGGDSSSISTTDKFNSVDEMVRAMSDPKYERDDHYRKQVEQKVIRSNLMRRR
jgi:hypothetical protein